MDDLKGKIRDWWASNPMTYGDVHGKTEYHTQESDVISVELGSREFFETADQRFYQWSTLLHTPEGRFGKIFPYAEMRGKPVLEVGCGMGCMAMNWAQQGAQLTAVDLNPVAVAQTRRRFEIFGLPGRIMEMDGATLDFPDSTFDYAYSWGVLHHSPNLKASLAEMRRVLKPGGRGGWMLYHRHSLLYGYTIWWLEGIAHLENHFLTPLELASRYSDGGHEEGNPHTWPVTREEVYQRYFVDFEDVRVRVLGADLERVIDQAVPRAGSSLFPRAVLKALARRWGWSLWITAKKPA